MPYTATLHAQVDEGDESKDKDAVAEKLPPAILTKPKQDAPPSSDFMDYAPPAVVQVGRVPDPQRNPIERPTRFLVARSALPQQTCNDGTS